MFESEIRKIRRAGKINNVDIINPFSEICKFLIANPDSLSWRGKDKPDLHKSEGISILAEKFVAAYMKSDFPAKPGTVPDEMVSIVMQTAYGYSEIETKRIKTEHQHAMCAENCVGALLERYIDSVLRSHRWVWCCGSFIRAVDFIRPKSDGKGWDALQIKNRDNSENSSSSAIRNNTDIQKWFRTFANTGKTNWDNLPLGMENKGLSEVNFIAFARDYLESEKKKLLKS